MTSKIILLLLTAFLLSSCIDIPTQTPEELEAEKQLELAMFKAEEARVDSLNIYKDKATEQIENKKFEFGIQYLDSALVFANSSEKNEIILQKAQVSFDNRKYDDAIVSYAILIDATHNLKETYYQRALCYQKQRKTQETVDDLKVAIELGNTEAQELHDKINPIKKRVAYYETRCCDGTTSNAKGSGACSHHGGVCNWNDPVYEEYRKY